MHAHLVWCSESPLPLLRSVQLHDAVQGGGGGTLTPPYIHITLSRDHHNLGSHSGTN